MVDVFWKFLKVFKLTNRSKRSWSLRRPTARFRLDASTSHRSAPAGSGEHVPGHHDDGQTILFLASVFGFLSLKTTDCRPVWLEKKVSKRVLLSCLLSFPTMKLGGFTTGSSPIRCPDDVRVFHFVTTQHHGQEPQFFTCESPLHVD